MESRKQNLVIILGPTCVGKSFTGIKLAKEIGGEIINCDSMQVYKGFDIGTDKPPLSERGNIPHHVLDLVEPETQFTAADFARLALEAAKNILRRKKIPIIAGGTGLYFKALLDGLFPGPSRSEQLRRQLEKEAEEKGVESLAQKLKRVDPDYYHKIGKNDRMRIIRALEVYYLTKKPLSEHFSRTRSFVTDFNLIKTGLKLNRSELYRRIEERVDKMFKKGIIKEVEVLLEKGVDEDSPPFRALGYKHVLKYLRKEMSLEEAILLTKRDTRRYAKRQLTWFRKMEGIEWFSPFDFDRLLHYVVTHLR